MPNSNSLEVSPVDRAPLELWLFNRRLTVTAAATLMGVSQSQLSRALRDPSDEKFERASLRLREVVKEFTRGEVTLDDWPSRQDTDNSELRRGDDRSPCASSKGGLSTV